MESSTRLFSEYPYITGKGPVSEFQQQARYTSLEAARPDHIAGVKPVWLVDQPRGVVMARKIFHQRPEPPVAEVFLMVVISLAGQPDIEMRQRAW